MTNSSNMTGADAVDAAISKGLDLDGSQIPAAKLDLYKQVMGLEGNRQRSGVSNTMRWSPTGLCPTDSKQQPSRIVRIGAKHISQAELNQKLIDAEFAPLKDKEVAFYYSGK